MNFSEHELLANYHYRSPQPLLIDVGAHRGRGALQLAKKGWRVIAFEPEFRNRADFERNLATFDQVSCISKAVSDVTARGTWMVGSYAELDRAIRGYLSDPTIHSEGRKIIREEHIEPLDGKASQRLVDYLVESARKAREGTLPGGDWGHTGLGDVTWASRQICNVQDYVQK